MPPFLIQIWATVQPLLTAIGGIVLSAGTITAFAYWVFQKFSASWLDSKFAKELEDYKHQQQKELQRLRIEIDVLLDRSIKLQSKELEVLPEAWRLLDLAFALTEHTARRGYRAADLNAMSPDKLEIFLKEADLPELHKEEIRSATDKTAMFIKSLRSRELVEAQRAKIDFFNYIMANGIFLRPEFSQQFRELHTLIHGALVERQSIFDMANIPEPKNEENTELLQSEGKKRLDALHTAITERIWSDRNP